MPSIEHFRTIVSTINSHVSYKGKDENGDPIYDPSVPKPKLTFIGYVKIHGTNFGASYNEVSGLWFQSKTDIITPQNDNAGAAFAGEANREIWINLMNQIKEKENLDLTKNTITVYGEWAGKSIQKGVGVTNIPKSVFIFGVKISPFNESDENNKKTPSYWVDFRYLSSAEHKIYNISDYGEYVIEIDFNIPQLSQNKIIEMTIEVEDECPVAKAFGFPNTVGEGIVFSTEFNGERYIFKSKGEKHAGKSKCKTLKPVDDERINKLVEIANQVTPIWRLDQMLVETFNLLNGGKIDRKQLGPYIKSVIDDVIKEDSDILVDAGFEIKDVSKYVSEIARRYFFEKEKEVIGL